MRETMSEAAKCANTGPPLTRSTSSISKEGLAMKATRICSFPECGRPLSSRGLCVGHVWQQRQGRDLTPIKPRRTGCEVADCTSPHYSLGYCAKHYNRFKAHGDPGVTKTGGAPRKDPTPCSVDGCNSDAKAKGFCNSHYGMNARYGDPEAPKQLPWFGVPFWDRVEVVDDDDSCWEWRAPLYDGRGAIRHNGRKEAAYRVAWTLTHGPIPDGLFVCHHCDNPPCVRPSHLFLGTAMDNTQDMIAKGRHRFGRPRREDA